MIFLISFGVTILFILLCGKALRRRPTPFYVGAVVLAMAAAAVTWSGTALPPFFSKYIWPVFARGGLAGAMFAIVMWTGAFPNGSAPIKRLMPIRGQLSILASILTLGHNAAYGKVYFVKLFTAPASLPANQLMAAVCSVLMLIIMLPLFVTSFQRVRRKMAPRSWKRLQRFAYGFYGLLCCHILLLTVPMALRGDGAYRLTVFVYGTVFLSYLLCRVSKALAKGKKPSNGLAGRQLCQTVGCGAVCAVVVLYMGMPGAISAAASGTVPENSAPVEADETPEARNGYRDGVYTGSAMGMNADIEVAVTVEDGKITDIEIVSQRDDEEYFEDALAVIDDMLAANSTEVDTVTGATWSSGGIIDAVENALESAGG